MAGKRAVPRPFLITSQYHAPRGKKRLYMLAAELSQRYLKPTDYLIGIIGAEGSGKSTLIQGLFPGLELTNDDDGINNAHAPLFGDLENNYFAGHTFHIDVRYELAFRPKYKIVEAVNQAVQMRKRVVIEHFDLIYETLGFNAQILFAIGEDLRIYRPTVFGPSPLEIKAEVDKNNKFRLMAHTAEDITSWLMTEKYDYEPLDLHSDVKHGFVLAFDEEPDVNLKDLEKTVKELIKQDIPIVQSEGNYIEFDDDKIFCTSKRNHVKSTGEIERFRLIKKFKYDKIANEYLLVGLVGRESVSVSQTLPPVEPDESGE
ncbi:MAG: alanine-tRNA synthetase second additional domain-containing protein [Planctomycetota bacterium]|jgi:hypothetical protein